MNLGQLKPTNAKSRARVIYKGKKKKQEGEDSETKSAKPPKKTPSKQVAKKSTPKAKDVAKKMTAAKKEKSIPIKKEVAKKSASSSRQKVKLEIKAELVEIGQGSSTTKTRRNSKDSNLSITAEVRNSNKSVSKFEVKVEIVEQTARAGTRRKSRDQSVPVETKKIKKFENLNKSSVSNGHEQKRSNK